NSIEEALQLKKELNEKHYEVYLIQGDLTNQNDISKIGGEIESKYGQVDVLINNAGGIITRAPFLETDPSIWMESFQLNLMSAVKLSQLFLPGMITKKYGRIINVSSMGAETGGMFDHFHYSSMKGAMNTLTKGLGKEFGKFGITVNAVAPGLINTPLQQRTPNPFLDTLSQKTPIGRIGRPEEVASLIGYLASEKSSYITGQVYNVM
ncbi:SDR family NAD(P)-dependent oxidoreductase, partial [Bacillus sp. JJ722]|uniref:SDR family NAD(P)-dependent oxidoreductase n=1 Tax=Bacillus sp. JJ722 TaxID=3122973 RepID=UPI002FFDC062